MALNPSFTDSIKTRSQSKLQLSRPPPEIPDIQSTLSTILNKLDDLTRQVKEIDTKVTNLYQASTQLRRTDEYSTQLYPSLPTQGKSSPGYGYNAI